jgi:hypothetical protein
LGAPDQGAVSSPLRPLGRNGEEIELTQSLYIYSTLSHPSSIAREKNEKKSSRYNIIVKKYI